MKRLFFRICLAALFLLTVLVVCFIVWRVNLAHDVNAKLAAIRASGLPTSGTELNAYYPAVPDNENAALVMTQAFALMRDYSDSRSNEIALFEIPPRGQSLTAVQRQLLSAYVEMNADALAKEKEIAKLPRSRYPLDFSPGFNTLLPHLGEIKKLARISEYQALLAINSNHSADADSSVSNILGMAATLNGEPTLISQLVRMALVSIANTTLEQRLNAGELDDTELTNLNDAFTRQIETNLIVQALIGERAMAIPFFRMSLAEINKLSESANEDNNLPTGPPLPGPQPMLLRVTGLFERDLLFYLQTMEKNITFASHPPPQSLMVTNFQNKMDQELKHKYCILSALLLPALGGVVIREARELAYVRAAETAIAVERFRVAHGKLSEKLDELVPQFLSAVPSDPFDGQPLRYHRLAKGYVIYSIGADGHDDGGREKAADWKSSDKTTYDLTFTVER